MPTLRGAVLLLAVFGAAGCQSGPDRGGPAPVPVISEERPPGTGLLDTGAMQLGPGAGQGFWRWQGDGQQFGL